MTGSYVEARTAEVFTGGCIMNSEAETMGREAVLAWQIDRGSFNGVSLDGLSVVAAVAGDRNLGMREMGGAIPSKVQSLVMVDERASEEQKQALVAFAREGVGRVSRMSWTFARAIRFTQDARTINVAAGDAALPSRRNQARDVLRCDAVVQAVSAAVGTQPSARRRHTPSWVASSARSGATRTRNRHSSGPSATKNSG